MNQRLELVAETQIVPRLLQVKELCGEFEQDWNRAATPADFDRFLSRIPDELRPTLLRNLVQIDISRRRANGEVPSQAEYLQRLPKYEQIVREEFLASTRVQQSELVETKTDVRYSPHALEPPPVLPPGFRLGEYSLQRELGRGGMGVVFEATHIRHGTRVALKTLPKTDGDELHRFKLEFRSLADINHPNLIGLHTLQEDAGQWFFTMDLIDGTDFRSYVRPAGTLDAERLRSAFVQLVRGVDALHRHRIVHRDLKPSNVMVTGEGCVQLLDFGLVVDLERHARSKDEEINVAGTPPYMAPEQFQATIASPAVDWYAVGVILFEALTGRVPFTGTTREIFSAKQKLEPTVGSTACPDLATICGHLLRRDPSARYDAGQILAVLKVDDQSDPAFASESANHDLLVGRDEELAELNRIITESSQQVGAEAVFVAGRSGEGKTHLVDHALERLRRDDGCTLLSGRCYDRESVPFKALDSLIDALCNRLTRVPERVLRDCISEDTSVLAELFPVFRRVDCLRDLPRAPLENLELTEIRQRAASTLRSILSRLSESTRLVLFVDDLQWGDAESAELLLSVLNHPAAPAVLLIGTYRIDEADGSRFLNAWNDVCESASDPLTRHTITLSPLSEAVCVDLVVRLVGRDTADVRRRAKKMATETGGSPFLISELARCYDPDSSDAVPTRLEEVLERKLTQLPADARDLLDVVTVSGHALAVEEVSATAGQKAVPFPTLARMCSERLLRLVGDEKSPMIDTYHDRVRESIAREMEPARKRQLHLSLAETIQACTDATASEGLVDSRVYDLAYHFYEADDPRAFDHQLRAGETAIEAFALEDAIAYLARAEQRMPEPTDASTRYRLYERLGFASRKTNHIDETIRSYTEARKCASTALQRAETFTGVGELQNRMGAFADARASLMEALEELGYPATDSRIRMAAETPVLLSMATLGRLIPSHRRQDRRERAEVAAETYHQLAMVNQTHDLLRYTHQSVRFAYTALRSGSPQISALGQFKLAYNHAVASGWPLAKVFLARGQRYVNEPDLESTIRAHVEGYHGYCEFLAGNLDDSERRLLESVRLFDWIGDGYVRLGSIHMLRHLYAARGDVGKQIETAEAERAYGMPTNNCEILCWAQYGLADALARAGRMEEAIGHADAALTLIDGKERQVSEAIALQECAFVRTQNSDYTKAIESCDRARRIIEKRGLFFEFVLYVYPRLVEALLGPDWVNGCDHRDLKRARRITWISDFVGWRFPNIRPMSLRVRGRLMAAAGRLRKASHCFEQSIEAATRSSANYERARSMLDLAAVTPEKSEKLRGEAIGVLREFRGTIPEAEAWQLGVEDAADCVAKQYTDSNVAGHQRKAVTMTELLVVMAIISVLIGMLLPAVQSAREAARRMSCSNNMRQVMLAMHTYESKYRRYPPGIRFVDGGSPLDAVATAWVSLLPQIEESHTFESISSEIPWYLQKASSVQIVEPVYLCPSDISDPVHGYQFLEQLTGSLGLPAGGRYATNSYALSMGYSDGYAFSKPGFGPRRTTQHTGVFSPQSRTASRDIFDGTSNTFAIGEAASGRKMCEGIGCDTFTPSNAGEDRANHGWLVGAVNPSNFHAMGWRYAGGFCSTVEPNNKQPVTDSYFDITDIYNDTPSWAEGPHHVSNFRSFHLGGSFFGFCDGNVRFLSDSIDMEIYRGLSTVYGQEVVTAP